MSIDLMKMADTVKAMRPMVPAKDFEISKRFYVDLGFHPTQLTEGLVEMQIGAFSFILQDCYIDQWADNFVMHLSVSDLALWWDHIVARDIASRYGVRTKAPQLESWDLVAGIVDPLGVLWRIAEVPTPNSN